MGHGLTYEERSEAKVKVGIFILIVEDIIIRNEELNLKKEQVSMLVVILSNKEKYKVSSALRASVTLINTRIYNGIFYFLASFLSFFLSTVVVSRGNRFL